MIRHGSIARLMMVELIGEIWIPDMQLLSFQSIGNKVHFVSGVGPERVERTPRREPVKQEASYP